ncbi:hypothetical protein IEM_05416 [Bacillus cereus BAG6O-2]|nr:hypothetical protein IEM_05416 [Bacillus cereus BAG6O-2]
MNKIYSFDQLTDSVELLERKPPRFIMGLLCFLFMSLLVFMIWAYIGKVDIVSKGTAMIQGKSDISVSRTQIGGIVDTVAVRSGDEVKKGMLEQLKQSIQVHKSLFFDDTDKKIIEEYKSYEQTYQSLQNEKDNEIKVIDNNKVMVEQDEVLQGLIIDKENIQKEINSVKKQKEAVLDDHKQSLNDKIESLDSQRNGIEKRIQLRKETLQNEGKKVDIAK